MQVYLVLLAFTLLHFADGVFFFFFKQIESLWQLHGKQIYWHHFSNSIYLLDFSVPYFDNSCNIYNFIIIIIILVMVICHQGCFLY